MSGLWTVYFIKGCLPKIKGRAAAAAKSLQSCPTLYDPIDSSPRGSPFPGILQARTLEWVAISFSSAWKWQVKEKMLSCVRLLATPWTAAYQAPLSMGFSRQEYWSGMPLPSPKGRVILFKRAQIYIWSLLCLQTVESVSLLALAEFLLKEKLQYTAGEIWSFGMSLNCHGLVSGMYKEWSKFNNKNTKLWLKHRPNI